MAHPIIRGQGCFVAAQRLLSSWTACTAEASRAAHCNIPVILRDNVLAGPPD